jgi:hypothetical protein
MDLSDSTSDIKVSLGAQETRRATDGDWAGKNPMTTTKSTALAAIPFADGRRTIVAVVSASIISLVVWGLVVVLKIH